jgi:hypothetical protein
MLLFVIHHLWSIIGDSGFVVSSIVPSAVALLSFHMSTGKLGSRPFDYAGRMVLMLDAQVSQVLDDTSLDVEATDQGPKLILVPLH